MEKNTEIDKSKEIVEKEEGNSYPSAIGGYLERIGKTPLLTEEEERKLAKKIKESREKLIFYAVKASRIIKDDQELLSLYRKGEKSIKRLEKVERSLERVREIADFLEGAEKEINKIKSRENAEKIRQIINEIKIIRPEYEMNRKKMIEANLRLVVSFAKKYTGRGVSLLDLIQEGNIGLSQVVDKFDYKCKKRFSTYASWWIRQALSRAVVNQSRTIRIPINVARLLRKLGRISRELEQVLGREPTPEEIAKRAHLSPEKIRRTMGITQTTLSFDMPVGENKDTPMINFIPNSSIPPPAYELTLNALKKEVKNLLNNTVKDKRELEILKLRFGLGETEDYSLREIGEKYGVSRERIRQIQERALNRLRRPAEKGGLRSYLELLDVLRANLQEGCSK